jgi:hypothetical protein
MVYALIYTLFLVNLGRMIRFIFADLSRQGFGLQIGNDFFLLLDPRTRRHLDELAANLSSTVVLTGTWVADNATEGGASALPLNGTWTFAPTISPKEEDFVDGCYRPAHFPWYLQPFPAWSAFIIVPLFSTLSSLAIFSPSKANSYLSWSSFHVVHTPPTKSPITTSSTDQMWCLPLEPLQLVFLVTFTLEKWWNGIHVNGYWCVIPGSGEFETPGLCTQY